MAIQELSAVPASDTYVGGNFYLMWWLAGDALHQTGYVVADHATNDAEVIVCGVGDKPYGVGALQADVDIDTAFSDGSTYSYYLLHAGTILRIAHDADAQASLKGAAFIRSAALAGMVETGTTDQYVVGWGMRTYDTTADLYLKLIT